MNPSILKRTWQFSEVFFRFADLVFLPEMLLLLQRLLKPGTRRLTDREIAIARSVFGETIDYKKVVIDERSRIGCRRYRFAYVAFNSINCWGVLSDDHFIHEMVHIWQYQRLGSVYIPRALWAQRTPEGYNYGGIEALQAAINGGRGLAHFNYEQQGDIVADYYRLKTGRAPKWCEALPEYLQVFESMARFER